MNSIPERFLRWQEGALTEAELQELNALLQRPEARRQWAEECAWQQSVSAALRAEQARHRAQLHAETFETLDLREADTAVRPARTLTSRWQKLLAWPARFRRRLALGGVVVALLGGGLYLKSGNSSIVELAAAPAPVTVIRGGRTLTLEGPGWRLQRGDTVRTPAATGATLTYLHEPTRIQLDPNSEIILDQTEDGKSLDLRRGSLTAVVAPQPNGEPMQLLTTHAAVTVLGTELALSVHPEYSRVQVISGVVRLARREDEKSIVVNAGSFAVAGRGLELAARAVEQGPWQSQDIGLAAKPGSACWERDGKRCRISAWGCGQRRAGDGFHFVYQTLDGDGEIRAQVLDFPATARNTKAGVVIRQSLKSTAPAAFLRLNAGRGLEFRHREQREDRTELVGQETFPYWVRLVRKGGAITAYKSPDGLSWKETGRGEFDLNARIYVGLGVASDDKFATATAVFDHITVTPGAN